MWKKALCILFFLLNVIISTPGLASAKKSDNSSSEDPCSGGLNALLNRPSVLDSACTVKLNKFLLEMGYLHAYLIGGVYGDNFPQAQLRIGLPQNTEFDITFPNFNHQKPSGFSPLILGVKHEINYTKKWILSLEGFLVTPTGSSTYGSAKFGGYVNALFAYNLTSKLSIDGALGVSTLSVASSLGGHYYTSINPDLLLAWQPQSKLQLYAEIYGQTRVSPTDGPGYFTDAGIQYLITPSFEVDAEGGVRLHGNLGGFNYYFGVGLGLLI